MTAAEHCPICGHAPCLVEAVYRNGQLSLVPRAVSFADEVRSAWDEDPHPVRTVVVGFAIAAVMALLLIGVFIVARPAGQL